MANISLTYATMPFTNSPSYGGIGWFDWGVGFSIGNGASLPFSATLPDGSTVSFTLTNTNISGAPQAFRTLSAPVPFPQAPFSRTGYLGIAGYPVLVAGGGTVPPFSQKLTFSNIVVKDFLGNTVPDFYIVAADAEATGPFSSEFQIYTCTPGAWIQIALLPPVTPGGPVSPSIAGIGTNTVTLQSVVGTTNAFQTPILLAHNPTQITVDVGGTNTGAAECTILGIAINAIHLNKIITNRFVANDQFNLSITGVLSSTTVTSGAIYGTQPVSADIVGAIGSSYVLNEMMDGGSTSSLSQYSIAVEYTNLSAGGTTPPSANLLPATITLALGDIFVATITNSIIPVTIVGNKIVDKMNGDINDTLTYTIALNNTGISSANNVILVDTAPSGTSFVSGSLTLNGASIPGNPDPANGVNLGSIQAGQTSTVTFQVTIDGTIPSPNPVVNTASGNYNYAILPVSGVNYITSVASTNINSALLASSKIVDKKYANVGDILTYTIPIVNLGTTTANTIIFLDTIPNGTQYVHSSLVQDGVTVTGSPSFPGATLPNGVGPSNTTTVTFQVQILTIPSSNPIINSASMIFSYTVDASTFPNIIGASTSSTNTVTTQVNHANLNNMTKTVDKDFAICGDTLNYTITIFNSGNTIAQNILCTDTLPSGTTFIPDSVFVNGSQRLGADPSMGISIPNIAIGASATVTFSVKVVC